MGPVFLRVRSGDCVLVSSEIDGFPYFGKILKCIGSSKDSRAWTLFQVFDIDNGYINIINACDVIEILSSSKSN